MAALCPACEYEPAGAAAGDSCPLCGTRLVSIRAPAPDEVIGTTIDGRFLVEARLGAGAMGAVYRARQTSIGREVALKLMDRHLDQDVAAAKRFFREAQLASKLAHPNTVSVIEFGQAEGGRLYLAMELVRGETLGRVVQREGKLPLARLARIGIQLCDALEAAHTLGIVHRDLKLDNVMLLDGGRDLVKVLDFGLARSVTEDQQRATATGVFAGTPRYLAPEVVLRGAAPAAPQDLYALGVLLCELAGGRDLWTASTMQELFARKAVAPLQLGDVPPALAPVISKLLDADPAKRPNATEARVELTQLATSEPTGAALAVPGTGPIALPPATSPGIGAAPHVPFGGESVTLPELMPLEDEADVVGRAATTPGGLPLAVSESAVVPIDQADKTRLTRPAGQPPPLPVDVAPKLAPRPTRQPSQMEALPAIAALEVEHEWTRQRAERQAAPIADPTRPPPRAPISARPFVVVAVLVGAASVGLALYGRRGHHAVTPLGDPARPTVSLHVIAPSAVDVMIDGAPAGKTPLTFDHMRGTTPMTIQADVDGRTISRHVTPDRDQEIDLSP